MDTSQGIMRQLGFLDADNDLKAPRYYHDLSLAQHNSHDNNRAAVRLMCIYVATLLAALSRCF